MKKFIQAMRQMKYSFRQDEHGSLVYGEVTGNPYVHYYVEDEPTEGGIFLKSGFELTQNDKRVLNILMGYL